MVEWGLPPTASEHATKRRRPRLATGRYVASALIVVHACIHVGGTRGVTWSIDQSIHRQAWMWIDPSKLFFYSFFIFYG